MVEHETPVVENSNGIPEIAPELSSEHASEASEGAIWKTARLLWESRRFLLRVMFWVGPLTVVMVFLIPTRYSSTTQLMPPDSDGQHAAMLAASVSKSFPGADAYAGELLGIHGSGALFVKLLQSRTVQDHVIERFNLKKVYWDRYMQDARNDLGERTAISEDRKSGVITVTVTDRNPQRAAQIAQAYVDELDRLVAQVSTSSARQERMFIEQRLKGVRADLDKAQKEFSEFASRNTALDIGEQTKAMVEAAATLKGQLIAAQSELQGLEAIYTSDNVRVRTLRARVGELQRQLQKLGGSDNASATGDTAQDELYPSIRQLPVLGVKWADLDREIKVQETVYELLTRQYELAQIQEAKEIPVVHVIDPADIPEKKSFPPRLLIIILITLFSSITAAAWVVGTAQWEAICPQDPRKVLLLEMAGLFKARKQRWGNKLHFRN